MKLMHLSDLHLGKTLCGYSMLDDQRHILDRILEITQEQKPDVILIAGDVFDRSAPSAEAVALLDDFMTQLAAYRIPILMISGNHDSPERIAYGGRIMAQNGIHLSPVYDGTVRSVTLSDAHGEVCFWLLPFLHPAEVRQFFPEIKPNATEALRTVIDSMQLDPSVRHVLLAHLFVSGAKTTGEESFCGTAEEVSAGLFAPFEYTALGHLHGPHNVSENVRIRYCGTPLKYSAKEAEDEKSVTFVELGEKGSEPVISTVPLVPLRDMKKLRGRFAELIAGSDEDYVQIVLTDETDVPDAMAKLRMRYPYVLGMDYDRKNETNAEVLEDLQHEPEQDPAELFAAFFKKMLDVDMSERQERIIQDLVKEIWSKEEEA